MKNYKFAARIRAVLSKSGKLAGVTVAGVVLSFNLASVSGPAQALKLYAQQNGNIPCSTCHTRSGLASGDMRSFTAKGQYFKSYGQLPPAPQPQPVPQPPVVNPQPPYVPPQPPRARPQGHKAWCARKYRSYKPWNDTYRGYDGYDHRCISPWSRGGRAPVQPVRPVYPRPVRPVLPVYPRPVPRPPVKTRNLSCNQAAAMVRRHGYRNVFKKNCFDFGRYTFYATKGGYNWRLRVRASNGRIYKVTPR